MNCDDSVKLERPLSEGDQIKAAIRELFHNSRNGEVYTETKPMAKIITNVNGGGEMTLCLCKHTTKKGAVVMWYQRSE